MARTLFLIFNHNITGPQEEDARNSLGITQIVDLPSDLKKLWSQVPPDLTGIHSYLGPVREWLAANAKEKDFVLIQGDFGACYLMVNFALESGLVPVYSTTRREAVEEYGENGSIRITHHFRHVMFREYGE